MAIIHYTHCPVCSSDRINPLLTVKDHSVSQEEFVIWQCTNCRLRFTQDVPDEESIGRYYQSEDYISHTNTSKGLINQLYLKVRKWTLVSKARLVGAYTGKKGKVLDLGAGTGAFLATMKEEGWEIGGIEPDQGARIQAERVFHIRLSPKEEFSQLPSGEFDAITLWHVLEHVQDLNGYISRMKELLKPEGRIFIAVPNYEALESSIYKLYWAAYDVPRHLYHFSPGAMEILMKKHSLEVMAKKPMWFDSFYISLLSSRYKNGKESWIGAGISGMRSNFLALFNREKASSVVYIIRKA